MKSMWTAFLFLAQAMLLVTYAEAKDSLPDEFGTARVLAARMVTAITADQLDTAWLANFTYREQVQAWYEAHRKDLIIDIKASKHIWFNRNANGACGQTAHKVRSDIHLSYQDCVGSGYDSVTKKAKFLIGESAHHLPREVDGRIAVVGDEFSDWIKMSVMRAWEKLPPEVIAQQNVQLSGDGRILPGAYQSPSYGGGVMLVNQNLRPIIMADKWAYPGVEVSYEFEGSFAWRGDLRAWVSQTTMGWTGEVNYNIGGVSFRGPYYCKVKVSFIVRARYDGKALNVTIRRPAKIESKDCKAWEYGYVDEHLSFVYTGSYSGAW